MCSCLQMYPCEQVLASSQAATAVELLAVDSVTSAVVTAVVRACCCSLSRLRTVQQYQSRCSTTYPLQKRTYCSCSHVIDQHSICLSAVQAEEEAKRHAEEAAALRASLEAGDKLDPIAAETALRAVLEEAGWCWSTGQGGPAAVSKVANSGLINNLNVEGGPASKAKALYAALFTSAAPASVANGNAENSDDDDNSKITSNGSGNPSSPKGNGAGSARLGPAVSAAADMLKQLVHDPPGQLAQLVALEWLLAIGAPERLREAPLALKALYDADITEEDIILAWHGRADAAKVLDVPADGAASVRKAVQPVIDWLQEAESDEEEDDSGDDE
eukprot:GHRR01006793.1.p1 GENE.GHRR01006793.1~~GHRR01006793.1.p1  ORF type:complete len:331 (+),score=124.63 GHRR01006793.1:1592-2584(+)